MRSRSISAASEDHVPNTARPSSEVRVSAHPLLLTTRIDSSSSDNVGHKTTTGEAGRISVIVLEEIKIAINLHSSHWSSLGYSISNFTVYLETFYGSPEVIESTNSEISVAIWAIE